MLSIIPQHIADDVRNDLRKLLRKIHEPIKKNPFRYDFFLY